MRDLFEVDAHGTVCVTDQGIVELAYQDRLDSLFEWQNLNSKSEYEHTSRMLDNLPFQLRSQNLRDRSWFTPREYQEIDLADYVLSRCSNSDQILRAQEELAIVAQLEATPIFLHLIYLVDHWRSRNLVWGVGRGSSVSCFLLYVIGINKINPLDYELDHKEFFKIPSNRNEYGQSH
jgi:DNA polymerase III alpha subunit